MPEQKGIMGLPKNPHLKDGPCNSNLHQRDGRSDDPAVTNSHILRFGAEMRDFEEQERERFEENEVKTELLNQLLARTKRPQTYFEMLEDYGKITGYYLPINNDCDKMLFNDFILATNPDVKEELARIMIDIFTRPKQQM